MLRKKSINLLIISFLLFLLLSKYIYQENIKEKKINAIDNYYSYSIKNINSYIAILEIPTISLKEVLYSLNSKNNSINKGIQILNNSIMPDQEKSKLYLAAHSGNSSISLFNDLENLSIDDEIYLYYKKKKYIYHVTSCYLEKKTGSITIPNKDNMLVLTTCSQQNKGNQFIVIADLVDIIE